MSTVTVFEAASKRLSDQFGSGLKPTIPNVLKAIDVIVDLIEDMFPEGGQGDNKRALFKLLLEFLLPDEWVDRHWPRIESALALVVTLKKARAGVRAARAARKG